LNVAYDDATMSIMQNYRIVEIPTGTGEVWKGNKVIGKVDYRLIVQQDFSMVHTLAGSRQTGGQKSITGWLTGEDASNLTEKGMLTLRLTDGRKIGFFVKYADFSNGYAEVVATGAFH
jgi:hypothetical protein